MKRRLKWGFFSAIMVSIEAHGRRLSVQIQQGIDDGLLVLAVEGARDVRSANEVFRDHAHRVVGTFPTMTKAVKVAEAFAAEWERSRDAINDPCDCGDIHDSKRPES